MAHYKCLFIIIIIIILLQSSVLGFTYCKAPEQLQNTWLRNTCDHPFVQMMNREK